MQINHLSSVRLQPDGQILSAFPATEGLFESQPVFTKASQIAQYVATAVTVLDYVSGMSVLVLYREGQMDPFYLDRVVSLEPGVRFSLLPVGDTCCIRLLTDQQEFLPTEFLPATALDDPAKGLQFQQLHTFLYQEFATDFYFRGEQHAPYELVYVNQGELHNLVRGQDILLRQHTFMLIDRNDWHTQYSDAAIRFLTVSFQANDPKLSALSGKAFSATLRQQELFRKMLQQDLQEEYAEEYVQTLFKLLLLELLQQVDTEGFPALPPAKHSENAIVDQAIQIISENTRNKFTLEALSQAVHVSIPYLHKLFQTHLGISPGKYITKIRMEECKLLLRQEQLTMGQIAQQLGFSSLQQFSRQFRNVCGVTPSQYLRSVH